MSGGKDDLDDLLNSALDELELDDEPESTEDLSNAAKKAAEESEKGAKEAEKNAKLGEGLVDDDLAANLLKNLDDDDLAKALEETLKMMNEQGAGEGGEGGDGDQVGDAELASLLQSLASAANGLEGADANQAEALGEKILQDMMKNFENLGSKEDFQGVMDGMMRQLIGKDVMYEPMKQVCDKFPEWLADNQSKLDPAEYERFGKQYQYYQKIVEVYETEPDNHARLTELFQEMQDLGQPPVEIIKELAPGLELGEDGTPNLAGLGMDGNAPPMPPNCAQQ